MGAGGEANNELGIAYRDIDNSGRRSAHKDQYVSQNTWSQRYMGERLIGMGGSIILIFVCIVWLIETPNSLRYGVSASAALLFLIIGGMNIKRRSKLNKIREQQLKEFNESKGKNLG